jgi:hypothetical protein
MQNSHGPIHVSGASVWHDNKFQKLFLPEIGGAPSVKEFSNGRTKYIYAVNVVSKMISLIFFWQTRSFDHSFTHFAQ